ncbi:MAG TPA: hypothetical protein VLA28_00885 [Afifellaceae bacterium]|nr:hypothetical protein [Afifellaceae bacterium]
MSLFPFSPADRRLRSYAFNLSIAVHAGVLVRRSTRFAVSPCRGPAASPHLAPFQVPAQSLGKPLLALVALCAFSVCSIVAHRGVA